MKCSSYMCIHTPQKEGPLSFSLRAQAGQGASAERPSRGRVSWNATPGCPRDAPACPRVPPPAPRTPSLPAACYTLTIYHTMI